MRKYKIKGIEGSLRTLASEIKLSDFKKIIEVQSKNNGDYNYYLDSFEILGLSSEFVDLLDAKALIELIKDFQQDFVVDNKYVKEFEIDGHKYIAFDQKFEMKARDFAKVESKIKSNDYEWISYAMAIIFKKEILTDAEHNDNAHIKYKQKLFTDNMTMDIVLPYMLYISETYIENVKLLSKI